MALEFGHGLAVNLGEPAEVLLSGRGGIGILQRAVGLEEFVLAVFLDEEFHEGSGLGVGDRRVDAGLGQA